MQNLKIKALADFLDVTENEAADLIDAGQYRVLTDSEADDAAEDYIKNNTWSFNASFILDHCSNAQNCESLELAESALTLAQRSLCEKATALVDCLIDDIDDFVRDAIEADGRGHFLAGFDGDEVRSGDFFIYRDF